MEKRQLGKTDMWVSVLGFGGVEIDGLLPEEVERVLGSALDAGLNVIDTAECYGESEELIGRAVSHRRNEYYLFTKCGHAAGIDLPDWDPHLLERSIDRSLQRLKTDHLDLLQLHGCTADILKQGEVVLVLQKARDAGKTRYIGYSGNNEDARYAIQSRCFDTLQTSINIADQAEIDATLPLIRQRGMGVIAKRPLANVVWKNVSAPRNPYHYIYWERLRKLRYDFLQKDAEAAIEVALRFTLSVSEVCTAIVGTSKSDRYQQNARMVSHGRLPAEQFAAIRERWKAIAPGHWRGQM